MSHDETRWRDEAGAQKAWEQACRQRWRALSLCIKAKLEACESGITTFEEEFLAQLVLPGGVTVAEKIMPSIMSGKMPKMNLLMG